LIFEALKFNQTIESLTLVDKNSIKLDLKSNKSLEFIETNQTLKSLNLSRINFSNEQMELISQLLCKNQSITELDFSYSNYEGSFEFLKDQNMKQLKYFKFENMKHQSVIHFVKNFQWNQSLNDLNLSFGFNSSRYNITNKILEGGEDYVELIDELMDLISNHKSMNSFTLRTTNVMKSSHKFKKLLKNTNLTELSLNLTLREFNEGIIEFFEELNNNESLTNLEVSFGFSLFEGPKHDLNFKIFNNCIENLTLSGKNFFYLIFKGACLLENEKLLESIFKFPSLKSLNISEKYTEIQEKDDGILVKILTSFGENTLERLSIKSKISKFNLRLDSFILENEKLTKIFKDSLMKNKHLKHLEIVCFPKKVKSFKNRISMNYEIIRDFLCDHWTNKTLETIKFYADSDYIPLLKEFILTNTSVKEILFQVESNSVVFDFTEELEWNTNLVNIENHIPSPFYFYYIERNKELQLILKRFSKSISLVKVHDLSFKFE
jgi:hypothetical protein